MPREQSSVDVWLARAAAGDSFAIQKLLLLHHRRLQAMAERRLAGPLQPKVQADDLLQEVYADVFRRIGEFRGRGPDSFLHWLERILASKIVDAQRYFHAAARDVTRERAAVHSPSSYESLAAKAAVDSLTPSRILSRLEAQSLLMAALAGLPPDYRGVLELRYMKSLPLAKVAALIGRTPAATQMLAARALRRLRAAVSQLSGA